MKVRNRNPQALRFDDEVALITGAGRGIGRLYAEELALPGAKVIVNDPGVSYAGDITDQQPADAVVFAIRSKGGVAEVNKQDVVESAHDIVSQTMDTYGRLDIVINNAGVAGGGFFPDIPKENFQGVVDVHVAGTLNILRAAWKHLANSGRGRVLNTSSASVFGAPGTSPYVGAKAMIFGLCRTLADEARPTGIRLNTVMPSAYTRLTALLPNKELCDYLARHYPPEQVVAFVTWLVHRNTPISGETFTVGAGLASRVSISLSNTLKPSQGNTPEGWIGAEEQLLQNSDPRFPETMWDAVKMESEHLLTNEEFGRLDL